MTRTITLVSAAVLCAALDLAAEERGTPAEAKAMLAKAVAHYKAVGRTQALADFNAKKAPYFDRDLYVFCLAPNHTQVGRTSDTVNDDAGKPMGKALWDAATTGGSVKYKWYNPVSTYMEKKTAFVQKVGDDLCGVGAYTP